MRRAENAPAAAEAWAAVAERVAGQRYPRSEFTRAWKQVLFNQFHDTLGGTAIEPAYRDARDQLGEASSIAARAQNLAVQSISSRIGIAAEPGTSPIVVFNPHAWPVRVPVELEFGGLKPTDGLVNEAGEVVAFQTVQSYATASAWRSRFCFEADLPPLGYRVWRVTPDTPRIEASSLRATGTTLENPYVRVDIDAASGRIAHLVLRDDGRDLADLADPTRPRAIVVDDTSDTWGHRRLAYRDEIGAFETSSVELIEDGPVRGIVRVESRFGRSSLVEDFILTATGRSIEIRVILDWHEQSRLLKLRFPTGLVDPTATFEIPYGAIERAASGAEEPGQRWVDVTGRYRPQQSGRGDGVRYEFQDQGMQRFTLALVPHAGSWSEASLTRRALELNQRPTILLESHHDGPLSPSGSYAVVEPDHLVLGAVKLAEDLEDLVLRVVETEGRGGRASVRLPAWDREVAFEAHPFEIRTFRVPRDPAATIVETDLLERPLR
jgi:alpha-mannosidase